ncbi:MAG: alpha-2-macroglobulin family protein, partial [Patescibacteria group bacterium]
MVQTGNDGRAQISFKLPDNLTTWVISALGATADTKAGQSTSEVVVSKEVVIRPVLPNILREGDQIFLSAL